MSKIIREVKDRELGHIVQTNDGRLHYVDSANTFDCGYETMSFPCNNEGHVISWSEEYVEHYCTNASMEKRHEYLISHLEEVLENE